MEVIASCDADDRGRVRDPRDHDREDCAGYISEVVGSDRGERPCPHPHDASISSPGGREVEDDMQTVEEGYLKFLPHNDAAVLQASERRDIDDNNNERVEVEEAPRAMEVAGMEGEADNDDGEDGIDGGNGGSPSLSMNLVLTMNTIEIEDKMAMESVGAPAEVKTDVYMKVLLYDRGSK